MIAASAKPTKARRRRWLSLLLSMPAIAMT
jgi:hypothetical protein